MDVYKLLTDIYEILLLQNFRRILCFHSISNKSLHKDKFEKLINLLLQKGITIVPLKEINNMKYDNQRVISLTFDDGYKNNITNLLPILLKKNIPATMFIITGMMDKKADDKTLEQKLMYSEDTVSKDDIETWVNAGMEIGFHMDTHLDMFEASDDEIYVEFKKGDIIYSNLLNRNMNKYFAYPFGYFPKNRKSFEALLEKNGYCNAFSVNDKSIKSEKKYYIPRIRMGDQDSLDKLYAKSVGVLDFYLQIRYGNRKNRL